MMNRAYDPKKEELVHLAGDPDRAGAMSAGHDLTSSAAGKPQIRYKDLVMTADVYMLPGEPITVHIYCPKCRHNNRITGDNKQIDYDLAKDLLSIEPYQCTWEMTGPEHRMEFGMSLCNLKLAIDNNVAKDA